MKDHVSVLKVCVKKQIDFRVGVGVHHGSALSPYRFSVIMNEVTKLIQGKAP